MATTLGEQLALSLRFGALPDEYDPNMPNTYDEIVKATAKEKRAAAEENQMVRGSTASQARIPQPTPSPGLPSSFAINMLRKMGWQEGTGLGSQGQGITAPLIAQHVGGTRGVIVQGEDPSALQAAAAAAAKQQQIIHNLPNRAIVLSNLMDPEEVDASLEDEMGDEASKMGNLTNVQVVIDAKNPLPSERVRVLCEYETIEDATRAKAHFHNRYFGGRQVTAVYSKVE